MEIIYIIVGTFIWFVCGGLVAAAATKWSSLYQPYADKEVALACVIAAWPIFLSCWIYYWLIERSIDLFHQVLK